MVQHSENVRMAVKSQLFKAFSILVDQTKAEPLYSWQHTPSVWRTTDEHSTFPFLWHFFLLFCVARKHGMMCLNSQLHRVRPNFLLISTATLAILLQESRGTTALCWDLHQEFGRGNGIPYYRWTEWHCHLRVSLRSGRIRSICKGKYDNGTLSCTSCDSEKRCSDALSTGHGTVSRDHFIVRLILHPYTNTCKCTQPLTPLSWVLNRWQEILKAGING